MRTRVPTVRLAWQGVLAAAVTLTCAHATPNEKGRLVPLTGVAAGALSDVAVGKRYALLVGIDGFEDTEAWHGLRYASRDARELGEALRDPNVGRFDEVITLTSPTETSLGSVQQAVERLAQLNTRSGDTVLLYISSHGTLARDAGGALRRYVVVNDTRTSDVRGTALDVEQLLTQFEQLPSTRKVAILAFCHSGHGKSGLSAPLQAELRQTKGAFFSPPLMRVSEAAMILSACAWGETAQEDERLEHDIYTYFFIEALRNRYDLDGDGAVSSTEAHDYARQRTFDYTQGRQRPTALSAIVGTDPIVLAGDPTRAGAPLLVSFDPELDGVTVSVNGTAKGAFPGLFPLAPGDNQITVSRAGNALLDMHVAAVPGERLDASRMIARATAARVSAGFTLGDTSIFASRTPERYARLSPALALHLEVERLVPLVSLGVTLGGFTYSGHSTVDARAIDERVVGVLLRVDALMPILNAPALRLAGGLGLGGLFMGRAVTGALLPGEIGARPHEFQTALAPLVGLRARADLTALEHVVVRVDLGVAYAPQRTEDTTGTAHLVQAALVDAGLGMAWQW